MTDEEAEQRIALLEVQLRHARRDHAEAVGRERDWARRAVGLASIIRHQSREPRTDGSQQQTAALDWATDGCEFQGLPVGPTPKWKSPSPKGRG